MSGGPPSQMVSKSQAPHFGAQPEMVNSMPSGLQHLEPMRMGGNQHMIMPPPGHRMPLGPMGSPAFDPQRMGAPPHILRPGLPHFAPKWPGIPPHIDSPTGGGVRPFDRYPQSGPPQYLAEGGGVMQPFNSPHPSGPSPMEMPGGWSMMGRPPPLSYMMPGAPPPYMMQPGNPGMAAAPLFMPGMPSGNAQGFVPPMNQASPMMLGNLGPGGLPKAGGRCGTVAEAEAFFGILKSKPPVIESAVQKGVGGVESLKVALNKQNVSIDKVAMLRFVIAVLRRGLVKSAMSRDKQDTTILELGSPSRRQYPVADCLSGGGLWGRAEGDLRVLKNLATERIEETLSEEDEGAECWLALAPFHPDERKFFIYRPELTGDNVSLQSLLKSGDDEAHGVDVLYGESASVAQKDDSLTYTQRILSKVAKDYDGPFGVVGPKMRWIRGECDLVNTVAICSAVFKDMSISLARQAAAEAVQEAAALAATDHQQQTPAPYPNVFLSHVMNARSNFIG